MDSRQSSHMNATIMENHLPRTNISTKTNFEITNPSIFTALLRCRPWMNEMKSGIWMVKMNHLFSREKCASQLASRNDWFFPRKSKKKQWAKTFQNNTTWSHKTAERGSMGPKNRRTISLHHRRIRIWPSITESAYQSRNLHINHGICLKRYWWAQVA